MHVRPKSCIYILSSIQRAAPSRPENLHALQLVPNAPGLCCVCPADAYFQYKWFWIEHKVEISDRLEICRVSASWYQPHGDWILSSTPSAAVTNLLDTSRTRGILLHVLQKMHRWQLLLSRYVASGVSKTCSGLDLDRHRHSSRFTPVDDHISLFPQREG